MHVFSDILSLSLVQYHSAPTAYDAVLKHLNTAFTVLFSMECILKIMAFGFVVSVNAAETLETSKKFRTKQSNKNPFFSFSAELLSRHVEYF